MTDNTELHHFPSLASLEELHHSPEHRTLMLGSSHLQLDLLPELFDTLDEMGKCESLDVLIVYCRGGEINVARRIALLLHEYTNRVRFIVPHFCQSAATLLSLCGHEIVAGPMAIFSPIDPQLQGADNAGSAAASLSAMEIITFSKMAEEWFSQSGEAAQAKTLELLSDNIFPPTMASFYRTCEEIKQIATELLDLRSTELRANTQHIIEKLLFGYHSHEYALTGKDLLDLGLNVRRDADIERWAWSQTRAWQYHIGGRNRTSENASWNDALIATSSSVRVRQREVNIRAPRWQHFQTSTTEVM